jgi:hypothetical protein
VRPIHLSTHRSILRGFPIVNRLDDLVARDKSLLAIWPVVISQSPNQVMLIRWGLILHIDNNRVNDSWTANTKALLREDDKSSITKLYETLQQS